MTSQWAVVDRIMYFISASPGFDFVMQHKVPPRILQPKYVLLISKARQENTGSLMFTCVRQSCVSELAS